MKQLFLKVIGSLELKKRETLSPLFVLLSVVSVCSIVISNVLAPKSISFFGLSVQGYQLSIASSFIVFPISYVLSDIFSEVYGYAWSRKISWVSFIVNLGAVGIIELAILMPGVDAEFSEHFKQVLGSSAGVLFASVTAYMFGDLFNDIVFQKLKNADKKHTNGSFVFRSIFSSFCGELVDCTVFLPLLYLFIGGYGTIIQSPVQLVVIILLQTALKLLVEGILVPVEIVIMNRVKKYENNMSQMMNK